MLIDNLRLNDEKGDYYENCRNVKKRPHRKCWDESIKYVVDNYGLDYVVNKQRASIKNLRKIYNNPIFFIDYYNNHQEILDNVDSNMSIFSNILSKDFLLKNNSIKKIEFPDGHPNELAHKLIADILYEQLFERNQSHASQ